MEEGQIIAYAGSPFARALDDPNSTGQIVSGDPNTPAIGSQLLQEMEDASFRGVFFNIDGSGLKSGRRLAVHQYFGSDVPWPEDTGGKAETRTVQGFLLGGNYRNQRADLIQALRKKGPGELVHPMYGRIQIKVADWSVSETKESLGRVEIEISFVEAGKQIYPTTDTDLGKAIAAAAAQADDASSGDFIGSLIAATGGTPAAAAASLSGIGGFLSSVGSTVSSGISAVKAAIAPVTSFIGTVRGVIGNVTSVANIARSIVPSLPTISFGRFSGASVLSPFLGYTSSMSSMVSRVSTLGSAVGRAETSLASAASRLGLGQ